MIEIILESKNKSQICRQILENLTDWFEDESARENYISSCSNLPFFVCRKNNEYIGFICLKPTSPYAIELYVMGVVKKEQRDGIGSQLFSFALSYAKEKGYKFIHVKTVKYGVYPEYDITNNFYKKLGFLELEILKDLWDENNPCQLYIMDIK